METEQGQPMDAEANRAHIIEVREAAASASQPQINSLPNTEGDPAGAEDDQDGTGSDAVGEEDEAEAADDDPAGDSSVNRYLIEKL